MAAVYLAHDPQHEVAATGCWPESPCRPRFSPMTEAEVIAMFPQPS